LIQQEKQLCYERAFVIFFRAITDFTVFVSLAADRAKNTSEQLQIREIGQFLEYMDNSARIFL